MINLKFIKQFKWWFAGATVLITLVLFNSLIHHSSKPTKALEQKPTDITTFIPKGYRLVPIQVDNYKSLDQILGNYSVVDLYLKSFKGPHLKMELLGSGIRALRAKNGSESIGLLVPKSQVKNLLKKEGRFVITINNSQSSGTEFVKTKSQKTKKRLVFKN